MFRFADINNFWWLGLPLLISGLLIYGRRRRRKKLESFAPELFPYLTFSCSRAGQLTKNLLIITSLILLVFSLARPQGNPKLKEVGKQGRDLVFVVDVSRSMLAEDLRPNRLERAKQIITEVIDVLAGDRIGLLVFAGSTAIKSPLTLDYNYFRNILSKIGPDDVARGGSFIGDAIRTVSERLFYNQDNKYRDVILITDGEDHQSFPLEAAKTAAEKGIKIHTVGLGDPYGSNIPIRKSGSYRLLKHNNQMVKTKLDEDALRKISQITKGVFIPVRTNLVDLAELYKKHIANYEKRESQTEESKIWSELFQFFLGAAIIALMLETLVRERSSSDNVFR